MSYIRLFIGYLCSYNSVHDSTVKLCMTTENKNTRKSYY
uniref:Uncharacterized protein n=1 Tax=Anguilla anguilla TaxID=7936 RepID=A0A0E9U7F5_ANGAN